MAVWQYGSMAVWEYGSMAVWQHGNMAIGSMGLTHRNTESGGLAAPAGPGGALGTFAWVWGAMYPGRELNISLLSCRMAYCTAL